MTETMRLMRANRTLASEPCAYCSDELGMGAEITRCEACGAPHHAKCWRENDGCAGALDCVNRPFAEDQPTAADESELAPNRFHCPHCNTVLHEHTYVCTSCRKPTSATGVYEGPKSMADGAMRSLVMGLIGLVVFGIILGPLAIRAGNRARTAIRNDVTLTGDAYALAGIVLGWIAIIGFVAAILLRIALS